MARDSLYILRDDLTVLCETPSIRRFDISPGKGGLRLRFFLLAAHAPDMIAEGGEAKIELLVTPEHLDARWLDARTGAVEARVPLDGEDGDDRLDAALRFLPGLPSLARAEGRVVATALSAFGETPSMAIGSEAIALLLRHRAVRDLMITTDGIDTSLQFHCMPGFVPVSPRPPQDWVGLDLDGVSADLSWFDADDRFHLHSLRPDRDRPALEALLADPLGHLITTGTGSDAVRNDAQNLLGRLAAAFSPLPL